MNHSVPPSIMPFQVSRALDEGEVAQLTCMVTTGDTPLQITWTFHGVDSSTRSQSDVSVIKIGTQGSLLMIQSATSDHSGNYTCTAKNAAGIANYTAELIVNG